MDSSTVKMLMAEQLDTVRSSALCRAFGWAVEVDGLAAFVVLRPRHDQEKKFVLRILFDEFPKRAPSYVFVDHKTREVTDDAWPPGVRHSRPPPGICTPGTRECHEHYHRNDAKYAWEAKPNSVLTTLAEIHRWMERGVRKT